MKGLQSKYGSRPRAPGAKGRVRHAAAALALAGGALLVAGQAAPAAVTVIEPGHTAKKLADSAFPLHPTQVILGTNLGPNDTGIESVAALVDNSTGIPRVLVYVQVIKPFGWCPSASTEIYEIDTLAGGVTVSLSGAFLPIGACERGTDFEIGFDVTGARALIFQDENGFSGSFTPEVATVTYPFGFGGGAFGVWSTPASFLNSTFGADFSQGGAIPPGDLVYVSDNGVLQILSAALGGPEIAHAPLPGPGDDL